MPYIWYHWKALWKCKRMTFIQCWYLECFLVTHVPNLKIYIFWTDPEQILYVFFYFLNQWCSKTECPGRTFSAGQKALSAFLSTWQKVRKVKFKPWLNGWIKAVSRYCHGIKTIPLHVQRAFQFYQTHSSMTYSSLSEPSQNDFCQLPRSSKILRQN